MRSNRTPFEIRADMLVLAKEILTERARSQVTTGTWEAPSTDDIIAEARKLNTFVSTSDSSTRD